MDGLLQNKGLVRQSPNKVSYQFPTCWRLEMRDAEVRALMCLRNTGQVSERRTPKSANSNVLSLETSVWGSSTLERTFLQGVQ